MVHARSEASRAWTRRHRYALAAAVMIAVAGLVRAPALQVGFAADDVAQLAMVDGSYPVARGAAERFTFSNGQPEEVRALRAVGYYPWWARDDLRLSLLRPLPSLLMGLDRALFGDSALPYHLHSTAWWLLLCGLVAALLGQLLPKRLALLALLVYLLDASHTTAIGWLANRNATMAGVFALCALLAHRARRRGGGTLALGVHIGASALAFACGEYAFAFAGYLAAHAFWLDTGALRDRVVALLPFAACGLCLLGARALLGYGAHGSSGYIEPFDAPLRFVEALGLRLPVLVGDAVLSVQADQFAQGLGPAMDWHRAGWVARDWVFDPAAGHPLMVGLGLLAAVVFTLSARVACGRAGCGGVVRFAAVGALLSLLPLVGSLPSDRHLLAPHLGVAIVVALCLERGLMLLRGGGARALGAGVLALLLGWSQLWVSFQHAVGGAPLLTRYAVATRTAALSLPDEPGRPLSSQRLYVVGTDDPTLMIYLPLMRALYGRSVPRSAHVLSGSPYPVVLERVGPRSLVLSYLFGGSLLRGAFERIFRSPDAPLTAGQVITIPGMRVQVLAVDARGRPTRMRMDFEHDLEDPRLRFVHQVRGLQLAPVSLPAVGARTVIAVRPMP